MDVFGALQNLDLMAVGIEVAATGVLGFTVFFNNRKSITNQTFLAFTLVTIVWGITNYAAYHVHPAEFSFWLFRLTIFWGVWHAFLLFQLLYAFPNEGIMPPRSYYVGLIPAVTLTAFLTLTSLIFEKIGEIDAIGAVTKIINGPAIALFSAVVLSLVIGAIVAFFKTTARASGIERRQFRTILLGISTTFLLLMTFNFILPAFFDNPRFIPLGPVFIFPFVVAVSYAILKHGLLNVRVVATEILTFVLAVVSLFEVVLAHDVPLLIFRSSVFVLVMIFGILLIQSVLKEIEQREEIERLSQAKSEFISIASHQLRTPLSIIKGYISMIREGSYGEISDKVRKTVNKIYLSNERLIKLVADLLDLSRVESGKLQYDFADFNIVGLIDSIVDEFKIPMHDKGLALAWAKPEEPITIHGDSWKLRQVIFNLIDNSLKYTPTGSIEISLQKGDNTIALSVHDTGVGMSPETAQNLFQKFSRGHDSSKINVTGLGLGLFIAKRIVDDHKGSLRVASEGEGKGSTFYLTLPVYEKI